MFTAEYQGINSFIVGASQLLLENGIKRNIRNKICWELPEPFMFKITNPKARLVTVTARNWNPILPYAEALWIASGRNDLYFIKHYLNRLKNYSDDGLFLRAGYGPRIRTHCGIGADYQSGNYTSYVKDSYCVTDQLNFVVETLSKNPNSRQAIISIGDPAKDCFDSEGEIKITKDFPCTRLLQFQKQSKGNKLDLTVYMRSNDYLWGASAVNIFNFTFILEYVSHILGFEVGSYFHIVNNFHYYDEFNSQIKSIANISNCKEVHFDYEPSYKSLKDFDILVDRLLREEHNLRQDKTLCLVDFEDDFFNDWYKVFYCFNTNKTVTFRNEIMNEMYNKFMKYDK